MVGNAVVSCLTRVFVLEQKLFRIRVSFGNIKGFVQFHKRRSSRNIQGFGNFCKTLSFNNIQVFR